MTTWREMKGPALRAELKRRDLPFNGRLETLVNRLECTDGLPIDRGGRNAHWEEEVKRYKEGALAAITTFPYFTRLPLEIQRYIWIFSLAEPRVLRCHNYSPQINCGHQLFFPKDWQPSNPAALFTCRESRAVALKNYKLCFGTTNVYADLPGGDMLYLADQSVYQPIGTPGCIQRPLSKELLDDLKAVTHIILPRQVWGKPYSQPHQLFNAGQYLWLGLGRYESLKRVSLGFDKSLTQVSSNTERTFVGYNEISDPFFRKPTMQIYDIYSNARIRKALLKSDDERGIEKVADWLKRRPGALNSSNEDAILFVSGFERSIFNKHIIGMPEVRVVELKHIVCMPGVVEERVGDDVVPLCCRSDDKPGEQE